MAVAEPLRLFLNFEPQSFGQPPRTRKAGGSPQDVWNGIHRTLFALPVRLSFRNAPRPGACCSCYSREALCLLVSLLRAAPFEREMGA